VCVWPGGLVCVLGRVCEDSLIGANRGWCGREVGVMGVSQKPQKYVDIMI